MMSTGTYKDGNILLPALEAAAKEKERFKGKRKNGNQHHFGTVRWDDPKSLKAEAERALRETRLEIARESDLP